MSYDIPSSTLKDYVPTAQGLTEHVKKALISPNIYVWGGIGEYLTDEILDEKIARFNEWYTPERIEFRRMLCNRGIRGYDCIGLILSYCWNDYSQDNTGFFKEDEWLTTTELIQKDLLKGAMEDLPERPGLVLWRKGHVGVYIGDGKVVESTTRVRNSNKWDYRIGGIILSDLDDCKTWPELGWKYWLEFPGIKY